jgi:hypothetical protein
MEVVAWAAAPWAVVQWSWILAVVVLVVLVALPSVFNVPGDKNHVGRPVNGVTRIAIETVLFGAAVIGAAFAWPQWAAGLVGGLTIAAVMAGLPRWRWLSRQNQGATNIERSAGASSIHGGRRR